MSDRLQKIPTFDQIMTPDTANGKIPSFADIMGEEVKKKDGGEGLPTGTESTAPLASPLPLDVEGIFSFGSLRKKTTSLPANLPRANKEIQKVLTNVHFGDVKPQELSSLYNNDYSRENAKKVIKEYAPEIPESAIGSDQSWEVAANNINTKNRVNFITAESQGINQLDATINSSIENLKLPTTEKAGQVTDYINELRSGLTTDDYSNNDKVSALIAKVQKLQDVEQRNYLGGDARNRSIQQTTTLLNELNDRLKYNISKTGVTPTINQLDEQINQAITGKVMQAERGTGEFDVSNDAEKANHFKLGLTAIEKTDPVLFKNVLGTVSQLKKVDDTDFTTISRIGQDIANTMKFRGGAYNPELIGTETEFDYSTFGQKVAEASATIGEWAKSKGYKNMNKFPERIIRQGAKEKGIDNPEIVNTLISNENLLMYDQIPKSGWVDDIVSGGMQPLVGINSTLNSWSESPAETYMRSKAFDSNIGAQKVPNAKGEYSDILPSEREKFTTDMFRGLGQFIPQVLLTKGVGSVARGVVGTTGAVLSTQKAKNVSDFAGTAISTFLQSYGPSYEEHLQKTGDADTAALIGTIDGISSAGFELLLPDVKIADKAFAGLRQGLSNNLIDLVKKGGDPAELAQKARPFVQKFFTNAAGTLAQENLEELGTTYVDFVTESIFDPASAKDRNLNKELWDTFKATSAAMVLPSILGAGGQSAQKDFTVKTLHSSAINFDNYKESLQKTLDKGYIDQAEFNGAVKLISTHKESIAQAPQQNINGAAVDKQKQLEYAYEDTKIKVYKEKAATSEGVAKEMWESKIKQSEDIQREILMPKAVEEVAPLVTEPAVELTEVESLLPALKENATDIEKGESIQYFIDKAAEDPAAFMEMHGKKATNQLLEQVPTEKLIENRDYLVKNFSESESTEFLTQIISQREKSSTPMQNQEGATGVVPSTLKSEEVPAPKDGEAGYGTIFQPAKSSTKTLNEKQQELVNELPKKKVNYKELTGIGDLSIYLNNPEALNAPHLKSAKAIYEDIIGGKEVRDTPSVNEKMQVMDGQNRIAAQLAAGIENIDVAVIDKSFYDKQNEAAKQQSTPTNEAKTTPVITPEENKAPTVVPLVQPKQSVVDLGTRVQTSEPPAAKGITPVTLSGLTEKERQSKIATRKKETTVTDKQKQTNDLLQKVKSYNSLPNGRLGKLRPSGLQQLNDIRVEAKKLGYKFDDRSGQLKTTADKNVRVDTREVGDRAIAPNAVVLRDRNQQTQDVFNQLNESGQFPNGYRLDNKQMSAAEIDGAIQDIVDGIPSERAENYLNQIEKYIANDRFEIGNPGEIKLAPSLNDLLGVQSETQTEPMTPEMIEAWLNDEASLTPEQEQTVIDNIENLIQDYEPEATTETVIQPTDTATESASRTTTEQDTGVVNKATEATKTTQAAKTKPTVKSLTNELRALLGNEAVGYNVNDLEVSQDSRGKYYATDVNTKEPVSPAFDNEADVLAFIENSKKVNSLPLTGDANPKNRIAFKDLGLTDTDTIETAIDKLIDYGGEFTDILKAIKADPNFKNVKLQLVDRRSGLENGESGLYFPVGYGEGMDNTLQIANKDNVYYTATHELLHFLTLDGDVATKKTPEYQALTDMYHYIADKKGKPVAIAGGATVESYGLTNEKEFMAELLINPTFRNYVSDVFAENKEDILKTSKAIRDSKVNSIGDIIFNFFKDIFNKLFSSPAADIPFDEKQSVVDNAAKLATQLFFGGQDVTVGQIDSGEGATVLGMGSSDIRTAALAFPSTNKDEVINSFVKSALDRGENEADIKEALVNNGISESDAQAFIDSNKPAQPKATTTKNDNEIISIVLNQRIDARTFPSIFSGNETQQQIAANTQGAGQEREVDGPYVVALEADLKEVSIQSAKVLRDELGADWGVKTLSWIEQNPSQGNIAQVIGLLNIISTENYQDIRDTHDGNRIKKLSAIQKRIDVVSLQRARDASTGLRQRILYAKLYAEFGRGGNMTDVVANSILSPELQELQADLNEVLSEPVTDEEINSAPPLRTTNPKKQSPIRKAMGTAKRKSNPAIKDELITKGAEAASKTKKSFKELIEDAKNKLKNTKC